MKQQDSIPQQEYIKEVIDSISYHSLYKSVFNFDSLENALLSMVSDSASQEELYDVIEDAVHTIDNHSYVLRKEKWQQMLDGQNPTVLNDPYPFSGEILNGEYAYISMGGFSGGDSISANNYCDSLQRLIFNLDQLKPTGWIIDLRNNSGGWAPAMFAGLGPILGEGVKAYTISSNNDIIEHYYAKSKKDYLLIADSVWTINTISPMAVLIGNRTGSAGELLALAFCGNELTKLIGEPTYGVSTDIYAIRMSDGFQICIASGVMTDRFKVGNGDPVNPEIDCLSNDCVFAEAYKWIGSNKNKE